ncbi:hypothetical protein [Streptomyces sp. NPDC005131]
MKVAESANLTTRGKFAYSASFSMMLHLPALSADHVGCPAYEVAGAAITVVVIHVGHLG